MSAELTQYLQGILPPGAIPEYPSDPEKFREILDAVGPVRNVHVVVRIESLHRYIQCIDYMHDALLWNRPTIFRGHYDVRWKLVPSLMRPPIFTGKPSSREVDLAESELMLAFRKRSLPLLRHIPSGLEEWWEWTALAQHHKLPTRMLDWTYRAGTALFFAVDPLNGPNNSEFSCVWAIKAPSPLDTIAQKYPHSDMPVQLYDPPHISPRIAMQQGCFTVHPGHYLKTYFQWIDGPRVIFLLQSSNQTKIRRSLHNIGIHTASIYPDLDGISRHLAETIGVDRDVYRQAHDNHGDA